MLFWTLGEYSYLSGDLSLVQVTEKLCVLAQRAGLDISTRGYAITAILKLSAQLLGAGQPMVPAATKLLANFAGAKNW